jgi:hypothetical protein
MHNIHLWDIDDVTFQESTKIIIKKNLVSLSKIYSTFSIFFITNLCKVLMHPLYIFLNEKKKENVRFHEMWFENIFLLWWEICSFWIWTPFFWVSLYNLGSTTKILMQSIITINSFFNHGLVLIHIVLPT